MPKVKINATFTVNVDNDFTNSDVTMDAPEFFFEALDSGETEKIEIWDIERQ